MTELPKGWATAKFSDFGEWMGGGTPSKAVPSYWNGPIPWVSPKDMKTNVIRSAIDGITEAAVENSAAKRVPAGSVLIVARSGILAHTLPIAVTAVETTLNQDMKALTLSGGISSDFIAWGLRAFEQAILNKCRKGGTTVHSIEMPSLVAFELPIPPTNEQRRIVEKIEAMFERIDKGVENLRGAKATLALYRQSLLKSAFEGKLTADWRAQNADKLETPKALLARIQKERETRYKSALDDWQTALAEWRAGGEVGRKPGKPIRLPEIDVNAEVSLQHVVLDVSQGWSPKCKNSPSQSDSTWAVIKTTAIQPTRFNDAENKELPEDLTPREDLELSCGDVLITRAGPRKRVGVACMVKQTRPRLMLCDKAYRLTLDASFVIPEFVELFLNAPDTKDKLEDLKSGISDSGLNLTQDKFLALPFWLPPKPEQAEITHILDTRLTAADRMEAEIDAALSRADALRQSILKRAFAGNLVPQDPTDEPAPTLLARIKAERAKAGKSKPRKTAHAG